MYYKAHVTYEVEKYTYGGQGFCSRREHIATFETEIEAELCAQEWKEANPRSWSEARILQHVNLLEPIKP